MTDILGLIGVSDASLLGVLLPAFKVVQRMVDAYERIRFGQKRCKAIIQQAALIVKEVHGSLRNDQIPVLDATTLQKKFEEIQAALQKLADMSFFKALLHFEDVNNEIERANQHLADCSQLFQINHSSHIQALIQAAMSDREALRALLIIIAGNYEEVRRRLGLRDDEQEDLAMAVMERELRNSMVTAEEEAPVELQIMQKSLDCIKTTTRRSIPKQNKWLIAEYDLDYCGTIGGGGFSTVSKAYFRGTMVAVKRLKDLGNMRAALEREIEIWSTLRHDHIVPFYGACTLTSPPYIVSRYMRNGNLVQYLIATPDADRTKLVFEVSLGMYYLHAESVVHGDLKGVNVLVDDSGKACITDFGLSKVCSPHPGGNEASRAAGTLRFLAPEVIKGRPLSFETDVYAFGMMIYETFTGGVPFSGEPDHVVLEGRLELHRPTSSKVYQRGFNDALWQLLANCISREPPTRPRFKMIQAHLFSITKAEPSTQSGHPDFTLGVENMHVTDWAIDTKPTTPTPSRMNNAAPFLEKGKSALVEPRRTLTKTTLPDLKTLPPILPMCIVATHKYFDVKFGVLSGRPDVHLEEITMTQRRLIKAKKGTLLREQGSKFWCRNSAGSGENSWELDNNDVTLRTATILGVCHFKEAQMAQKWFRLQLSYARDGTVESDLVSKGSSHAGMATGDWFLTERSWRRLIRGRIQQADVVDGAPKAVPIENSWNDVAFPKHYTIGEHAVNENSIVCTTNPGKQPGRFSCKRDGRTIFYETYRWVGQSDQGPMITTEETYPSKEYAEMTFDVLRVVLGKGARKSNKWNPLSF